MSSIEIPISEELLNFFEEIPLSSVSSENYNSIKIVLKNDLIWRVLVYIKTILSERCFRYIYLQAKTTCVKITPAKSKQVFRFEVIDTFQKQFELYLEPAFEEIKQYVSKNKVENIVIDINKDVIRDKILYTIEPFIKTKNPTLIKEISFQIWLAEKTLKNYIHEGMTKNLVNLLSIFQKGKYNFIIFLKNSKTEEKSIIGKYTFILFPKNIYMIERLISKINVDDIFLYRLLDLSKLYQSFTFNVCFFIDNKKIRINPMLAKMFDILFLYTSFVYFYLERSIDINSEKIREIWHNFYSRFLKNENIDIFIGIFDTIFEHMQWPVEQRQYINPSFLKNAVLSYINVSHEIVRDIIYHEFTLNNFMERFIFYVYTKLDKDFERKLRLAENIATRILEHFNGIINVLSDTIKIIWDLLSANIFIIFVRILAEQYLKLETKFQFLVIFLLALFTLNSLTIFQVLNIRKAIDNRIEDLRRIIAQMLSYWRLSTLASKIDITIQNSHTIRFVKSTIKKYIFLSLIIFIVSIIAILYINFVDISGGSISSL